MEDLQRRYYNVSRDELNKIWETSQYPSFNQGTFETTVGLLHTRRENEKIRGRISVVSGPLIQIVSVSVQAADQKPSSVYGTIELECPTESTLLRVYDRDCSEPQLLGPTRSLDLICPDCPSDLCLPAYNTKIGVDISDGIERFAAKFDCVEDTSKMEDVRVEYLRGKHSAVALRYIVMPFAVYGRLSLFFYHPSQRSLHLFGKIVARYGNTYDNCSSVECTLFEKNANESDIAMIDGKGSLELSRSWIAVPVYSSLVIDLQLWEFGSNSKFLEETVEVRVKDSRVPNPKFMVNGTLVILDVAWFSPRPQGAVMPQPWQLSPHMSRRPISASAVEIFSVYMCRKGVGALQLHGSIEILRGKNSSYGFKKEAGDAFILPQHCKTLPVLDGPRLYSESESLKIKVDISDIYDRFHVKGRATWDNRDLQFDTDLLNTQVCSIFQSDFGIVAVHYSVFPEAVQAKIGVVCTAKSAPCVMLPQVSGSIVAYYNNYDYMSGYNKDYYRVILFQKDGDSAVSTSSGGVIALDRATVVVPLKSTLVIDVNLKIGANHVLMESMAFDIGKTHLMLENNDYSVGIHLKWVEVDG